MMEIEVVKSRGFIFKCENHQFYISNGVIEKQKTFKEFLLVLEAYHEAMREATHTIPVTLGVLYTG